MNDPFMLPFLSPFFLCHPEALAEGSPYFLSFRGGKYPEESLIKKLFGERMRFFGTLCLRMTEKTLRMTPLYVTLTLSRSEGMTLLCCPFCHPFFFVTLRALARSRRVSCGDSSVATQPQNDKKRRFRMTE